LAEPGQYYLKCPQVRKALVVARCRGKKLGTHNPKVKGKGARAVRNKALELARTLAKHVRPLKKKGCGAKRIRDKLNMLPTAVRINGGRFYKSKVGYP